MDGLPLRAAHVATVDVPRKAGRLFQRGEFTQHRRIIVPANGIKNKVDGVTAPAILVDVTADKDVVVQKITLSQIVFCFCLALPVCLPVAFYLFWICVSPLFCISVHGFSIIAPPVATIFPDRQTVFFSPSAHIFPSGILCIFGHKNIPFHLFGQPINQQPTTTHIQDFYFSVSPKIILYMLGCLVVWLKWSKIHCVSTPFRSTIGINQWSTVKTWLQSKGHKIYFRRFFVKTFLSAIIVSEPVKTETHLS